MGDSPDRAGFHLVYVAAWSTRVYKDRYDLDYFTFDTREEEPRFLGS